MNFYNEFLLRILEFPKTRIPKLEFHVEIPQSSWGMTQGRSITQGLGILDF